MATKLLSFHRHLHHPHFPFPSTIFRNKTQPFIPLPRLSTLTTKLTTTHEKNKPHLLPLRRCSVSAMDELNPDPSLSNDDLKPTTPSQRSFSGWEMASLWIDYLVDLGMAWWQGISTVVSANLILLIPLILTGEPGTRYGISFPVLARSSFGIRGAHIPTLLRALVGCGWYGIETWIGGEAIFLLLPKSIKESSMANPNPLLGTSPLEFVCFLVFWIAQLSIVWKGMDGIRELEKFSAPILILLTSCLLIWAYINAAGFALNIPDFTRYAKSQKDQIIGQAGLPIFMGAFTFVGLAVTSSTSVIFGRVISSPIQLLGQIGGLTTMILAIFGISLATITTNIAANVVAPANALVNLSPSKFTFRRGALLTALLGIAFQPWRLLHSSESFVYTWLVSYSALLGPIGGIVLADYYLIKHRKLSVKDLYSLSPYGAYFYSKGYNMAALAALIVGILPVIPGFLQKIGIVSSVSDAFVIIYNNAWFSAFSLQVFSIGLFLASQVIGTPQFHTPSCMTLQKIKGPFDSEFRWYKT
ncbi:hypothetical protein UlMin_005688 [Ulmus minor]